MGREITEDRRDPTWGGWAKCRLETWKSGFFRWVPSPPPGPVNSLLWQKLDTEVHPGGWDVNNGALTLIYILNIYLFGYTRAGGILSRGMQTLSRGMWALLPWPGVEPRPPALGAQSLRPWTTREVSNLILYDAWIALLSENTTNQPTIQTQMKENNKKLPGFPSSFSSPWTAGWMSEWSRSVVSDSFKPHGL